MKKLFIVVTFAAHVLFVTFVYSQVSHTGTNRTGTDFVGYNSGSTGPLDIRNDFNDVINFRTNSNPQAVLDANGNFSIGQTSITNYFGIGISTPFLWHNGTTTNIYAGIGAGSSSVTGTNNTFIGFSAGNATIAGHDNTFVGFEAGSVAIGTHRNVFVGSLAGSSEASATGEDNTFVGYAAGRFNNGGEHNSFFGDLAGQDNSTGNQNTAIGGHSLENNVTGNGNVCLGYESGLSTTSDDNTFIGFSSGLTNTTGTDNTFLGANSDCSASNLTNSAAIGSRAIVTTNNSMILGDNLVYVGIGLSTNATGPVGMLSIHNTNGYDPGGNNSSYGLHAFNDDGSNNDWSTGGYFEALGGKLRNFGVYSIAVDNTSSRTNFGVYGGACGGSNSSWYGGYFTAKQNTCSVCASCSAVGMYCEGATWAAYVNGAGYVTSGTWSPSDANLKMNVVDLDDGLQYIMQLQPKEYDFDQTLTNIKLNLPVEHQYGFYANELANVLPPLVKDFTTPEEKDDAGNVIYAATNTKAVNPTQLIPILVAGMQQQQTQIINQQQTIDSLLLALSGGQLRGANPFGGNEKTSRLDNTIEIELTNVQSIILDQNDPNPFTDQTTIDYFIPETTGSAKIIFFSNSGSVLRTVEIKEKGKGSITVYASNLAKGIYSYSLIIDGKVFETKKMVKQ